jgi:acetyl esterase/lipase
MGGFGVLYYGITNPAFSKIAACIYPAADLRYGVGGDKLADYDPAAYAPLDTDDIDRVVNASNLGGLAAITERWLYYPVFDSDAAAGPVWKEDLPVWRRLMAVSPADLLRDGGIDLAGARFFILAGDRDDFNIDSQVRVAVPLLGKAGAGVYPEQWVIPGGRHHFDSIMPRMDELVKWIGNQLSGD